MYRLIPFLAILLFSTCTHSNTKETDRLSEAGAAFRYWSGARCFPDGHFCTEKYAQALAHTQLRGDRSNQWEALGPKNVGGRTLCLAIHPIDTNILWAGSASGGLWKSATAGKGAAAWERVETGFPVLGVSSIAINPANPNEMYIGTGEVYGNENTMPNVAVRITRGTYGIGILKSTDGGDTWAPSLDWSYGEMRGVQDIKINPKRPATLYAATTEGLLRSYNSGTTWTTVHNLKMAVDIEINPVDTSIVFVTHGSLNNNDVSGIYRSTNGGSSFFKLSNGLPGDYAGKTLLGMSPDNPNILYASIADDFAQKGLYKSANGGNNWTLVNSTDVCTYQGWYSHDVAVQPGNTNTLIWTGIDLWKSENSGADVARKTLWYSWFFGYVPAGEPEGPYNYVHADIHRVYYPNNAEPNKIYCVTDGGIFVSYDNGESWSGRNGGYQTQQFYANMGNSATDPNICIGGMQDNATAIYNGDPSWTRVIGGDGECAAINSEDDQIMYGSSQYLAIRRSTSGGQFWQGVTPPGAGSELAAFNGPFELSAQDPYIMYAGAESLYKSEDGGSSWINYSNGGINPGNPILTMAIAPDNNDVVWLSTYPVSDTEARVYKTDFFNAIVTPMEGLPNRVCMDIAIHPTNPDIVYAVFSGFNAQHVWRTSDGGGTWTAIDNGLPDLPTNTILIDPIYPEHIYVGNDVGVWVSRNSGNSWEYYSDAAPKAMLVMHLSISADHRLRVASYGLGVWETDMAEPDGVQTSVAEKLDLQIWPNPCKHILNWKYALESPASLQWQLMDASGRVLQQTERITNKGDNQLNFDLSDLPSGHYYLRGQGNWRSNNKAVTVTRKVLRM